MHRPGTLYARPSYEIWKRPRLGCGKGDRLVALFLYRTGIKQNIHPSWVFGRVNLVLAPFIGTR